MFKCWRSPYRFWWNHRVLAVVLLLLVVVSSPAAVRAQFVLSGAVTDPGDDFVFPANDGKRQGKCSRSLWRACSIVVERGQSGRRAQDRLGR